MFQSRWNRHWPSSWLAGNFVCMCVCVCVCVCVFHVVQPVSREWGCLWSKMEFRTTIFGPKKEQFCRFRSRSRCVQRSFRRISPCTSCLDVLRSLHLQIDADGKAARDARLCAGDVVVAVNDVDVRGHEEALQVIQSAFNTLTVTVKRSVSPNVKASLSYSLRFHLRDWSCDPLEDKACLLPPAVSSRSRRWIQMEVSGKFWAGLLPVPRMEPPKSKNSDVLCCQNYV